MILLIDNYDSFSYNVYQLIGSVEPDIRVVRNDELTVEEIEQMQPEAIILLPGPGRPAEAGICIEIVKKLGEKTPILGICLGHQAICEACGATVSYATELMHGKQKKIRKVGESALFTGLPESFDAARYHSLAVKKDTLPECLRITAVAEDGEVMAIEHREYPIFGLQFHPESVMTPQGKTMIEYFMNIVRKGDENDQRSHYQIIKKRKPYVSGSRRGHERDHGRKGQCGADVSLSDSTFPEGGDHR